MSGNIRDPYPRMAELRRRARSTSARSTSATAPTRSTHPSPSRSPCSASTRRSRSCGTTRRTPPRCTRGSWARSWAGPSSRWTSPSTGCTGRWCRRPSGPRCSSGGRVTWSSGWSTSSSTASPADGSADLVQELTFNFPVQVIAEILGLPRADFPTFQRWAIEITSVASNWDRGVAASAALRDYFADVLEERRRHPGRRSDQRPAGRRGGRAGASTTRRSSPSSACCCRPGWRPPTGPRATSSTVC